ncbi:hypothetical protein [Okeania sp. SIO2G5]|uniref:hypothetical protein n=1 Tax=Okeania sp. SIO2G5 TaxID=2607796 RepID=UPI0013C1D842|nr:hypothetical protein [Okeania sp. SIO2G5]NEP76302.1 hypothetical protein [Okeania sp. SIO2G5]
MGEQQGEPTMKRNGLTVNGSVPLMPAVGTALVALVGGLFMEIPQVTNGALGNYWHGSLAAIAQTLPPCAPPESDEYLVLVNQQTPEELEQLKKVLPNGSTTTICQYLDDGVIRVGGFANEDVATAWAEYLGTTLQVQTAIVRPATAFSQPGDESTTAPSGPDSSEPDSLATVEPDEPTYPDYTPQVLEEGYAVLVDYADRTDIAIAVQTELGESVGLAVYRQDPYLIAFQSEDFRDAGQVLRQLIEADYNALMVDSRQVVLMTPAVAVTP